jgi:hypothetical protein
VVQESSGEKVGLISRGEGLNAFPPEFGIGLSSVHYPAMVEL